MPKSRHRKRRRSKSFESLLRGLSGVIAARGFEVDERKRVHAARFALRATMLAARSKIPKEKFQAFAEWLSRQYVFRQASLRNFSVGFDSIDRYIDTERTALSTEVSWLCQRFVYAAASTHEFLRIKTSIEEAIWRAKYERAVLLCEEAANRFGQSIWLIKVHTASLQLARGLESQKEFVRSIERMLVRGLVPFIAHYVSVRNEPRTSIKGYRSLVTRILAPLKPDDPRRAYLLYHLAGEVQRSERDMADVLRLEQSYSDIDAYETLVNILFLMFSTPALDKVSSECREEVEFLAQHVNDGRLGQILSIANLRRNYVPAITGTRVGGLLFSGDVKRAAWACRSELRKSPGDALANMVLAICHASVQKAAAGPALHSNIIFRSIRAGVQSIFVKGQGYEDAIAYVSRTSLNLCALDIFAAVMAVVEAETKTKCLDESAEWLMALSRCGLMYDPNTSYRFESEISKIVEGLQRIASSKTPHLVDDVFHQLQELRDDSRQIIATKATIVSLPHLANIQDYASVCSIVCRSVALRGVAASAMPIRDVLSGVTWPDVKAIRQSIVLPTALHIAASIDEGARDSFVRFAIDQLLVAHDVEFPSQLSIAEDANTPLPLTIYFFDKVCVPEMLEHVKALDTSEKIEDERVRLCERLATIDHRRASEYQREIIEITQRRILTEGVRLIDSTRIHVDEAALADLIQTDIGEDYRRYIGLLRAGLGEIPDFESVVRQVTKGSQSQRDTLTYPKSEASDLFLGMVATIRTRFLVDPVHGLNAYLSRRVRHGTILGELRGPLEPRHLVTDRLASGTYAPNKHWLTLLGDTSAHNLRGMSEAFGKFNRDFDIEILRLKDSTLHIKSNDNPNGLFDIPVTAPLLLLLRSNMTAQTTINEFIAQGIAVMWATLGPSLASVRRLLDIDLSDKVAGIFGELKLKAKSFCEHANNYGQLAREISNGADDVQQAIQQVASWFERRELQAPPFFTCDQAVGIALQSILSANKGFEPQLSRTHLNDIPVVSTVLPAITDILHVALVNAKEHSGLHSCCPISIKTDIDSENELMTISVRNPTEEGVRSDEIMDLLRDIRTKIEDGSFVDKVYTEGKSGLVKLASMLAPSGRGRLSFGFAENNDFLLTIELPLVLRGEP